MTCVSFSPLAQSISQIEESFEPFDQQLLLFPKNLKQCANKNEILSKLYTSREHFEAA